MKDYKARLNAFAFSAYRMEQFKVIEEEVVSDYSTYCFRLIIFLARIRINCRDHSIDTLILDAEELLDDLYKEASKLITGTRAGYISMQLYRAEGNYHCFVCVILFFRF